MLQKPKLITLLRMLIMICAGGFFIVKPCLAQKAPFFTTGTEFSFPYVGREAHFQHSPSAQSQSFVQITATAHTCGTLQVPNRNFLHRFYLEKDSTILIALPQDTFYLDTLSNIGIMINTSMPVQVVFAMDVGNWDSSYAQQGNALDSLSTEATSIAPISKAGTEYILNITDIESNIFPFRRKNEFWAYALFDSSHISIDLSNINSNLQPKDTLVSQIFMSRDCFYSRIYDRGLFPNTLRGFSGSLFHSVNNKPFSVFAGRTDFLVGRCIDFSPFNSIGSTGEIFDQSKPIDYGDTLYTVAQIKDHYPNIYSILALEDNTIVKLNGSVLDTIQKTYQIDTCYYGEAVITSNKPVLVTLTRSSFASNAPTLQPNSSTISSFSITLPGSGELMKRSVLKPFSEEYKNTYVLALFTKSGDTANFILDGQPLPIGSWQPFAARLGWAWAQIEVSDKTHIMESSGEGFIGYHYSYAKKRPNYYYYPSYGYCLIESKALPEDSLHFYIKTESTAKEKFNVFNTPICVGEQVQLFPNAAHHIGWQWNFGDGNDTLQLIKNENGKSIFHTYTQPGQYWLTVTDTGGCTTGDSVLIEVLAAPKAQFSTETFPSCDGLEVRLTNQSQGANAYSWALPGGETSSEENPVFKYNGTESFQITLTATIGNCSSTVTETVTPNPLSFQADAIPNVFSPNGDGQNDCYALADQSTAYIGCFSLNIYNRWGKKVWGTQNPTDCWDGQINGAKAAAGTYYYILEVGPNEAHGSITLMR